MSRTKQAARKNGPKPTKKQSKENQTKSEDNGEAKSNNIKANRPLLQLNKSGGIVKSKRPVSIEQKELNKRARLTMVTGELNKDELKRKTDRDLRTLYIRFKGNPPKSDQDVYKLDKNIRLVRIPRQGQAKKKQEIKYCYAEFSDEAACEAAKDKLASNPDHYVDFVGVKSKKGGSSSAKKMPINPTRLHVSGLVEGIDEAKLKKLFPKCESALIPKGSIRKNTKYGFVQFKSPADAKAAFDAAGKLKVDTADGTTHLTVVFARVSKHGPKSDDSSPKKENKKDKKAKKRSNEKENTSPAKKQKSAVKEEVKDENEEKKESSEDDNDENESSEENDETENNDSKNETVEAEENDQDDDDESGEEEGDEEDADESKDGEGEEESEEDDDDDDDDEVENDKESDDDDEEEDDD